MRSKNKIFGFYTALLIFVTIVAFQNCSNVNLNGAIEKTSLTCMDQTEFLPYEISLRLGAPATAPNTLFVTEMATDGTERTQSSEDVDSLYDWVILSSQGSEEHNGKASVDLPTPTTCTRYQVTASKTVCGEVIRLQADPFQLGPCVVTPTTTTTSTTVTVPPPPPGDSGPSSACNAPAKLADPKYQPERSGFTRYTKQWGEIFFNLEYPSGFTAMIRSPRAWPQDAGQVMPIGSYTLGTFKRNMGSGMSSVSVSKPEMRGKYITTPFTPTDGRYHKLSQAGQQTVWSAGIYSSVPYAPQGVYVTISECPGDFRLPTDKHSDRFLDKNDHTFNARCRTNVMGAEGPVFRYRATPDWEQVDQNGNCSLIPGRTYYLNFIYQNPLQPFNTTSTTCLFDDFNYVKSFWNSRGVNVSDHDIRTRYQYRCMMNFTHVSF